MNEERYLKVVNGAAIAELFSIPVAIDVIAEAMRQLSGGEVEAMQRWALSIGHAGRLGLMPGHAPRLGRFGLKLVSLFDDAHAHGLPRHQGLMVLLDAHNGRPLCALECHALTAIRTAAASAVATRALACPDAETLAIIGCGEQARWHVRALCQVRALQTVLIWGRSRASAQRFADAIRIESPSLRVRVTDSVEEACERADIICTVTSARMPVIRGAWLRPGQHVNLVGASTRNEREADVEVVACSRYYVDHRGHALSQAGELRDAVEAGLVDQHHVVGEIGQVLNGDVPGRACEDDITVYKSLGHVMQDIAAAEAVYASRVCHDGIVNVAW